MNWRKHWGSFSGRLKSPAQITGNARPKRSPLNLQIPSPSFAGVSLPINRKANGDRETGRSSGLGSSHFVTFPKLAPQWHLMIAPLTAAGPLRLLSGFPVRSKCADTCPHTIPLSVFSLFLKVNFVNLKLYFCEQINLCVISS